MCYYLEMHATRMKTKQSAASGRQSEHEEDSDVSYIEEAGLLIVLTKGHGSAHDGVVPAR